MADALLDWAYHSNQDAPRHAAGTAVASLVTSNLQLVQAVGGFGLALRSASLGSTLKSTHHSRIFIELYTVADFEKLSCEQ